MDSLRFVSDLDQPFILNLNFVDSEASALQEEWKELARKELEDWAARQSEQLEKTKAANRYGIIFKSHECHVQNG